MAEAKEVSAEFVREGVEALIDRLGAADAARFIAILGGEGDSVKFVRECRRGSTVDEIVEKIKARKKLTGR